MGNFFYLSDFYIKLLKKKDYVSDLKIKKIMNKYK